MWVVGINFASFFIYLKNKKKYSFISIANSICIFNVYYTNMSSKLSAFDNILTGRLVEGYLIRNHSTTIIGSQLSMGKKKVNP